ncbi:MAG: metal ABC transporter permease [Chitinispirillaceae bacterium]|nr:metal ABC transporter permease [Chitinispirillaceae bacterium]
MEALVFMLPAFIAALIIAGIHCYLGLHIVSRGIIFIDLALAQIAALGYAFALILGYHIGDWQSNVLALAFAMAGSLLFTYAQPLERRMPLEAVIGIGYVVAAALAVLVLSFSSSGTEDFEHLAMGNILVVSWKTIIKTTIIYALVGAFHWIFRKKFVEATFSRNENRSKLWDFLFYFSLGIAVSSSVAIAGVMLVFSYLIIPSVFALMLFNSIKGRLICGWIAGFLASTLGLLASFKFDFPTASTITVSLGLLFIASIFIGAKMGRFGKNDMRRQAVKSGDQINAFKEGTIT